MHFIYFSLLTCFSVSLSYFPVSLFCFLLFSYLPVFLSFPLSLSLLLSLSLFLVLLSNSFSVSLSPSFPKLIYLDRYWMVVYCVQYTLNLLFPKLIYLDRYWMVVHCTVLSKPLGMAHSELYSILSFSRIKYISKVGKARERKKSKQRPSF